MKTGFFCEEDDDNGYDFLENLCINNINIDAMSYLHGDCQLFSLALCKKYGYKIILWREYNEDIKSVALVHAFNVFEYEGKEYFVDVRGITDSLKEIMSQFDYWKAPDMYKMDYEKAIELLNSLNIGVEVPNELYNVLLDEYNSYYDFTCNEYFKR